MEKNAPPRFDPGVQTVFLRLTIARAVTPRAAERARQLRELERLLARAAARHGLGVSGFLLNALSQRYPVSKRAMWRELVGCGPQGLVEAAEQIELSLWTRPGAPRDAAPGAGRVGGR